jgi:hypothetical protein
MLCPQCQSSNRREFRTEMMIHKGHLGGAPRAAEAYREPAEAREFSEADLELFRRQNGLWLL